MKDAQASIRRPLMVAAAALTAAAWVLPLQAAAINATPEAASLAMDKAIVAGDGATLDTLIAPDFLWVREGGKRTDKKAFVQGLATPGVTIEPFSPREGRWLKSGDIAVFSAVNELHGSDKGEAFVDKHSFVDVWRHDPQGWRLVYTQVTKAPEGE